MDVHLLGSVEACTDGDAIDIGTGKQRALFALLALHEGATVSSEQLIEGLWGEDPPASATKLVQLHVSHLRKALATAGDGAQILTRAHGYELRLEHGEVDVRKFERLLEGGRPHDALALWRGPALHDVAVEPFAAAEVRRLEELRLTALELKIDQALAAGRHREVVAELEVLVEQEPLREQLHVQRMLALYRCGRQADALEAYRHARSVLVEEVGIEPGPELRDLHEAILRQEPSLAADRLGEAASRVAAERPALRAAEDDLVGGIVARQASGERSRRAAAGVMVCPFKGLTSFDVDDAPFFAGRERLVAELVARLTGAPLTAVVGPSGSGKSSVLRAGLLASLADGVLPGSERWTIALLRPGEHPMRSLSDAVAGADPRRRLVVAVDQVEELFTACRDEDERRAFADAIVRGARDARRRATVVMAIRADFYGRCAAYPELARMMAANHVLVGPLRRNELRRAIELPARRADLDAEPDLVDALASDVEGRPGALPLLSTALLELWQERDGQTLSLASYRRSGGVEGAVARLAERAYSRLDPGQQQVARSILLRLAGEGDGEAVVRRRVPLTELEGEHVAAVLAILADERLVTITEDEAEVAHEALLREWPRLRAWLDEDAEGRRLRGHLAVAARDWDAGGRDPGELYRGSRLASTLEWVPGHEHELTERERAFVAASRDAAEHESRRQRQVNRRLRFLLGGAAALLAVAILAGIVAISQRGEARDAALVADAQRVGADAVTRERLDTAALMAKAGVDLDTSAATRGNLLSVLMRTPAAIGTLPGDGWPVFPVAVSPDGRRSAIGDERGMVVLFDERRRVAARYELEDGFVQRLRFSPDGRTLAVGGHEPQDEPPGALVDLVDVETGSRRSRIVLPDFPDPNEFVVANPFFLPDGRNLVVQQLPVPDTSASILRRYDVASGRPVGRPLRVADSASWMSATRDGRRLVVTSDTDNETTVIDAQTLRVVDRFPAGGAEGAVSGDGRWYAFATLGGEVRLLDLRSGDVRRFEGEHGDEMQVTFALDDRVVVTSADDGRILLWDVDSGTIRDELAGHEEGTIWGLAVTTDGRTLYSGGADGRVIMWDVAGDRRLDRRFTAGEPFMVEDDRFPPGLSVSPDGRTFVVTQSDGTVDVFSTATLARRSAPALRGYAAAADHRPDGRVLAVTGENGEVRLLDARTLRQVGALDGMTSTSQALAYSPDGRYLAAAELLANAPGGEPGIVHLWDARRGTELQRFRMSSASIAFSPNGRLLAAADVDGGTQIRRVAGGPPIAKLVTDELHRAVAFSPDGELVATGDYAGTTWLWSTDTWKRVGRVDGPTGRIQSIDFTPSGATMLTAAADGTVRLWDVASRKPIGPALSVEPGAFMAAAFTPDGRRVIAASEGGRGVRWEVSVDAWRRQACRIAARPLTEPEWREALPGRAYRPVCSG